MQKRQFLIGFFKPILLYIAAIYLLGFSFNGLNVYGFIDYLIPLERAVCFVVAIILGLWFGKATYELGTLLFKKEEKPCFTVNPKINQYK
jgi:hypothetical protein